MSCPEFKQKGLLYNSGELNAHERELFEHHLEKCAKCQHELGIVKQTLQVLEDIPLISPGMASRNAILAKAHGRCKKLSIKDTIISFISFPVLRPRWVVATSAIAVILIFTLVMTDSFHNTVPTQPSQAELTEWDDYFIIDAYLIDIEIERIASGRLLTNLYAEENGDFKLGTDLSTMSNDFILIRYEMDEINNNMQYF